MKLVFVVVVVLIDMDGCVFLVQCFEGKFFVGLWEFLGGKVEVGEIFEVVLIWELYEELVIEIWQFCLVLLIFVSYSYDNFYLLMLLYVCRCWNGVLVLQEGQMFVWLFVVDLSNYFMLLVDVFIILILCDWL